MLPRHLLALSILISSACSAEVTPPVPSEPAENDPTTPSASTSPADEAPAPGTQQPALIPPPPRASVDGIRGFTALSTVRFAGPPSPTHRLSATYTFPDRARWYLEPANAATGQRTVIYRSGPQVWQLAPSTSTAARFHDQQELQALLQLELRRAALFWPRGIAWEDGLVDGPGPASVRIFQLADGCLLGARFRGSSILPTSFFSRLPGGAVFEDLLDVQWAAGPQGSRPVSWSLHSSEIEVWSETIEEISTDVRYVDAHFLPPHLRELPTTETQDPILLVEVPARTRQRHSISSRTWPAALAEALAILNEARELGLQGTLDPNPVFELDGEARPRALFIRLIRGTGDTPDGWERAAGESALSRLALDAGLPERSQVDQLRAARPQGTRTGPARVRLGLVEGRVSTVQLMVPLVSEDGGD